MRMKKILLTMLTLLAWSSSLMAQDPEQVVGAYSCDLYISLDGPITDEMEAIPEVKVLLTRSEQEGCVNFELRDFYLDPETPLGDIILPNIPLVSADEHIGFAENSPVRLTLLGSIVADATLNPSTSLVSGDRLTANVDVSWLIEGAEEPYPIYVRAIGTKLSAVDDSQVVGTYTSDLYISLDGPITDEMEAIPGVKVQLTKGNIPGNVNFELRDFYLDPETPLGDIILPNIPLIASENATDFTFAENDSVSLTLLGSINALATLNPATSYVQGNTLLANVDVAWLIEGADPYPIYVRAIGSKDGAADGIDRIATSRDIARSGIYSLSGVRMNAELNALPRGIYIVNGKKVVK